MKQSKFFLLFLLLPAIFWSCDTVSTPLDIVTRFEDIEEAILYTSSEITPPPDQVDTLLIMTWNIRYGAKRLPWFGDGCGERVVLTDKEVKNGIEGIAEKINEVKPDILLIQEMDRESKRTGYIDEIQWLLDNTYFNYSTYASIWQVQFIPSDGLGKMDMGNVIMSKWEITQTERIQLPLRGDQDALTQYFYLRRNILKAKIALPGYDNFYTVNIHASAFSMDDTKKKQIDIFKDELDELHNSGVLFVAGGDLNELPPGAAKTDYCEEDQCPDEIDFHAKGEHREGSYFAEEVTWLVPIFESKNIHPAVSLDEYLKNEKKYFTHGPIEGWDRKIDYLFTNGNWVANSDSTYQAYLEISDHTPVSARLVVSP